MITMGTLLLGCCVGGNALQVNFGGKVPVGNGIIPAQAELAADGDLFRENPKAIRGIFNDQGTNMVFSVKGSTSIRASTWYVDRESSRSGSSSLTIRVTLNLSTGQEKGIGKPFVDSGDPGW
ncbi:MAG: hypothetical protein H6559_00625 [Lewinellaceae bacterium]|nr:hypothetical protein [Lewinellaceae bacterium]